MRAIIFFTILMASNFALAQQDWQASDFQVLDMFKDYAVVKSEKVFEDELKDQGVYQVSFAPKGECSSGGVTCEPADPMCEYVVVDNATNEAMQTEVTCDQPLEQVIQPEITDQL